MHSEAIVQNNSLEFVMVNHEEEDDPSITQLIDTSIDDVTNHKNTLALKLESVMSLMREVEREEKAAEQAKDEAAQSSLDVLVKLDECKRALRHAQETNHMLVTKLYVHKAVLATKMEAFKLRTSHLLDAGDRFFDVLDEMSRSLDMRFTSALMKKEVALKKKQENEAFARAAVACEDIEMEKVELESKSLKQEAMDISNLLELLMDRDHALVKLQGEISDKYENVKLLKEEVEQGSLLGGLVSILEASISSSKLEGNKTNTIIEEGQHAISSDGFIEIPTRDVATREENERCAKIKKNLHRNKKFAKRIKIKGLQVVSKRTAAADPWEDEDAVTLRILMIMIIFLCVLDISMLLLV